MHFLGQALRSVREAMHGLDIEVFVVDNNSVDGSVPYIRKQFPWVKLIANKENVGFARANNQAIRQANGRYVLLLNPDTIVEADTFQKTLRFMDEHPDAGALGVRMVNGEGEFLPESKRSLPTPMVAFYKIFGLSKLFPGNPRFGKYHLTYLPEEETNEVEVLSGAFMMLRKEVLEKIGYLDEDYFMYGEDVDLSYRVTQAGYKNYYFPETTIIHYKGESTKKGSLNYVLVFYNAMLIFVRKHFSSGRSRQMVTLIKAAIYFRASLSLLKRVVQRMIFPVGEFILFSLMALGICAFWFDYTGKEVPREGYAILSLGYAGIVTLYLLVLGAYRQPFRIRTVFLSVFAAFVSIATILFLMPPINRSRVTVGLFAVGALLLALLNRGLANFLRSGNFFLDQPVRKRLAIVGNPAEARRVGALLEDEILYNCENYGTIVPDAQQNDDNQRLNILGNLNQLSEVIRYYQLEEVVFCNESLPTRHIIDQMSLLAGRNISFKIVPPKSDYLVGPNTILTVPGMPSLVLSLHDQKVRLRKILFDRVVAFSLLFSYPLTFWIYRRPWGALRNISRVIRGNYHLVSYIDGSNENLPRLKNGLLDMRSLIRDHKRKRNLSPRDLHRLDRQYARNYTPALDWQILLRGLRLLGNKS